MFADFAKIFIQSGKGGDGHVSFRRELYIPNGGPNGGDGGKGGDVIFEVDKGLNTLYEFRHKHNYKAEPGQEGGKQNKTGKNGADLIIRVPEGTIIREAETGKIVADMSGENNVSLYLKVDVVVREISITPQLQCRFQSMPSRVRKAWN